MTDYTGVSLDDVVAHLVLWKKGTDRTISDLNGYRETVGANSSRLDDPGEILRYLNHFINLFARFANEFERLSKELHHGVRQSHVDAVLALYETSRLEDDVCISFKRDHIQHGLKDESLRHPLIDRIYGDSRDQLADYLDLSNVAGRLTTLVGYQSESPADSKEIFVLKPTVYGMGVDLKSLARKARDVFRRWRERLR